MGDTVEAFFGCGLGVHGCPSEGVEDNT